MASAANVWDTSRVSATANRAVREARAMEVHDWCMGDEALAVARRILGRKRLYVTAEDLVSEAKVRVLRTLHNRQHDHETFHTASYCTRAMSNYVKTLLTRRNPSGEVVTGDFDKWLPVSYEPEPSTVDHGDIDRFCAAIEALGQNALMVSGALTATYLQAFATIPVDDAPWPKAGVADARSAAWPALWYATRDKGLFPTADGKGRDGRARTRQRHLVRIDGLRLEAATMLTREGRS